MIIIQYIVPFFILLISNYFWHSFLNFAKDTSKLFISYLNFIASDPEQTLQQTRYFWQCFHIQHRNYPKLIDKTWYLVLWLPSQGGDCFHFLCNYKFPWLVGFSTLVPTFLSLKICRTFLSAVCWNLLQLLGSFVRYSWSCVFLGLGKIDLWSQYSIFLRNPPGATLKVNSSIHSKVISIPLSDPLHLERIGAAHGF